MKYIDIYSYIIQENLKLADPNILDAVVYGMNLTATNNLSTFMKHLQQRWHICKSSKVRFEENNKQWLQNELILPTASIDEDISALVPTVVSGRPQLDFDNSSSKTKKRRLAPLVASFSSSELLFASGCSLCQDGREKEAKAVLQLSENEPNFSIVPYTPEKVLALILDCGLSKDSYRQIRLGTIEAGCKLYPPYNAVRDA